MKYKIIALIGKAGSGKDFTLKQLLKKYPLDFHEIISCTTRPKREKEVDGLNYHFLSSEKFAQKLIDGEMIEATIFNDWAYGTAYENLRRDEINIGVFNPVGINTLLENKNIDLKVFYIIADDKTRLLRQLNRENDPNCKEIIRRFQVDEKDFSFLDFDYIPLYNNNIDDVEKNIIQIFGQGSFTEKE